MARPKITRYTTNLVVTDFDCGDEEVNNFLKQKAADQIRRHITEIYVISLDSTVIGYYAFFSSHLHLTLPETPKNPIKVPGVCLGQLGVDKRYAKKGLGEMLIKHCIAMAYKVAKLTACRIVWVDAYDNKIDYYRSKRFHLFDQRKPNRNRMYFDLFPQK